MLQSNEIKELAAALVQAQSQITSTSKDADNPFFKSKYVTLDALWKTARPILAANGLSLVQTFNSNESGLVIETILMHTSGQWLCGSLAMPVAKPNDPQAVGSASTYARRYSMAAMLGMVADEDDDGNSAAGKSNNNGNGSARNTLPPKKQQSGQAPPPAAAKNNGADNNGNGGKGEDVPPELLKRMYTNLSNAAQGSEMLAKGLMNQWLKDNGCDQVESSKQLTRNQVESIAKWAYDEHQAALRKENANA